MERMEEGLRRVGERDREVGRGVDEEPPRPRPGRRHADRGDEGCKKAADDAKAQLWGQMGLPTKRDQERSLHLLNQLQSRIMDLEEKLQARG